MNLFIFEWGHEMKVSLFGINVASVLQDHILSFQGDKTYLPTCNITQILLSVDTSPLHVEETFSCHLSRTKHTHWAKPATRNSVAAACGATCPCFQRSIVPSRGCHGYSCYFGRWFVDAGNHVHRSSSVRPCVSEVVSDVCGERSCVRLKRSAKFLLEVEVSALVS